LRKIFEHEFYTPFRLERVVIDGKRHYVTPEGGKYKSVTTILDEKLDKTALFEWRKRVGEAEAIKISTQAANRGTAIHNIAEQYLLNKESYPPGSMPANIDTFRKLRPIIDKHIGKIYGLEYYLYSDKLKTAGATDCIAEFDGVNSIIDFKTSKKPKKEEWIQSYFLQATAYALMAEERLPLVIPQIAIMIAVDHEEPQVFVKPKYEYVERVLQIFA
jgi:ATP-dependent exoDNAse (exonuclease V) beta subunit